MDIKENVQLAPLTTFGTGGSARYYTTVSDSTELAEALQFAREQRVPFFILGGGSNTVVSDAGYEGLVIHITSSGITHAQAGDDVLVTMAAGEVWDDVVAYAVEHDLWGVENMSHIPGLAGAFVVQNVGAYGQDASQVTESVTVFDTQSATEKVLTKAECGFAYRESIFNTSQKGRYIVLSTTLRLHTTPSPLIEYPDIQKYFADQTGVPTLAAIRQAIITIRDNKFPDWKNAGTAGSFFKNLYLTSEEFTALREHIAAKKPELLADVDAIKEKFSTQESIKIPTAFIIDKVCGLKGKRIGGATVSESQALAILNPEKKATSDDVVALIALVKDCVHEVTGREISVEPEFLGF